MCGIGFVINYGKESVNLGKVEQLFMNLEERGTDASGFYWERQSPKGLVQRTLKAPITATTLWGTVFASKHDDKKRSAFFKKFQLNGKEKVIMLHTRAKTKGTELDNMNNMPIFNDDFILIHNGVIRSERYDDYDYKGEVDSEEILANITKLGLHEGIAKSYGSMAIALRERQGTKMWVYRRSNPLDILYMPDIKQMWGMSLIKFMSLKSDDYSLEDFLFSNDIRRVVTLPENTLYQIDILKPSLTEIATIAESKPTGVGGLETK